MVGENGLALVRIWRTSDGHLVREGDDGAAFLAYTVGGLVSPADRARLKQAQRPLDKSLRRPTDKSV